MVEQVDKFTNQTVFEQTRLCIKEEFQNNDFPDYIELSALEVRTNMVKEEIQDNNFLNNGELSSLEAPSNMIEEEVRVEKIEIEDAKIMYDNGLLSCDKCHKYYQDYCTNCRMLVRILNRNTLNCTDNIAYDEIPKDVLKFKGLFGHYSIFALKPIPKGVTFGPFSGLGAAEWKVKGGKFLVSEEQLNLLNWMHNIKHATSISEQNLCVYQYDGCIYYRSTQEISEGKELLVYFGREFEESLKKDVDMVFVPIVECNIEDVFACTFCCLGFSSRLYLVEHKTKCSNSVNGEFSLKELVQCSSCKIYLSKKEYLGHHMAYCSERNPRQTVSLPHAQEAVKMKQVSSKKGKAKAHQCLNCYRSFANEVSLRKHAESAYVHVDESPNIAHGREKPFKCCECVFQTKTKYALKAHVRRRHLKEIRHECSECDYGTFDARSFQIHKSKHLADTKHKCGQCNYETVFRPYLERHMKRVHTEGASLKCPDCEYKTNANTVLKSHIERNHAEKIYKHNCTECEYKAYNRFNLRRHHKRKHVINNKQKHKCGECSYETLNRSHLDRHIESQHRKNSYRCVKCDYTTNCKQYLYKHVRKHHPNK